MKRAGEEMELEALTMYGAYQFTDFSIANDDPNWQIVNNIGTSHDEQYGVLLLHRHMNRPLIIMLGESSEYFVCYMNKMLSNQGLDMEGYCFEIFEDGQKVVDFLGLLNEYYCTELCIVDDLMISDMIAEMIAFLSEKVSNDDEEDEEKEKERKIIKATRTIPPVNSSIPFVDADKI